MPANISGYDVLIVVILGFCIYRGWRRGLVRTVYGLFSVFVAVALANLFHGVVGGLLAGTPLFGMLQAVAADSLGLSGLMAQGITAQAEAIYALPLPDHLRMMIMANNNPEMHDIFGVTALEEFIAAYIAGLIINMVSVIIVFILVSLVMRTLSRSLGLFNRLPVIGKLNRAGGAVAGAALGTFAIWVILAVVAFAEAPGPGQLPPSLEGAVLAGFFHHNNMLLDFLARIF